MAKKWLRDRLTPTKRKEPIWAELADGIQEVFDKHVGGLLDRLDNMGSLFTMKEPDFLTRLNEMGAFFAMTTRIKKEDRQMFTLQRKDQIAFKKTTLPVLMVVNWEFEGLKFKWAPTYCPKADAANKYKDEINWRTAKEIADAGEDINDYFLTSRGYLEFNKVDMDTRKITEDDIAAIARSLIDPIIPINIAYSGEKFIVEYDLREIDVLTIIEVNLDLEDISLTDKGESIKDRAEPMKFLHDVVGDKREVKFPYSMRFDAVPLDAGGFDQTYKVMPIP